jgi:membrane protein
MGGSPYRAVQRAVLRSAERVWHDLRFRSLYRSGKEFELMQRALGFAALAILTVIPLLILVAAASPAPHRGLAGWVVYGMGLTGSSADAVTRLFSAPRRVLGTTSVFSALVLSVSGVALAGSVQAGFERIWGLLAGPWHKIWRQAVWLAALIAYIFAAATVGSVANGGLAETAGRVAVAVVLGIAFFWWGLRFLLGGRVSYLAAMPGAVATLVGLEWPAGLLRPGLRAAHRQERGQLRRAGLRPDRGLVADRRRLGRLRRTVVRALVLRRLAAGLGAQPRGPPGAGRRGRGRAVPRESNYAAWVVVSCAAANGGAAAAPVSLAKASKPVPTRSPSRLRDASIRLESMDFRAGQVDDNIALVDHR